MEVERVNINKILEISDSQGVGEIWLGGLEQVQSFQELKERNIGAIVSIDRWGLKEDRKREFQHFYFPLDDSEME